MHFDPRKTLGSWRYYHNGEISSGYMLASGFTASVLYLLDRMTVECALRESFWLYESVC
ncbi:hypothetical protein P692DRAFT_201433141 [Suillus brevipes Sb2]|nr:hypothetical protein P692DRAFT_201433141 [Suillus brevipes Sb2]